MRTWVLTGLVIGILGAGAARGEDKVEEKTYPLGLGVKVGTLGFGADMTMGLTSILNLRAGMNYGKFDVNVVLDEADVEGHLRWMTVPLLLDIHPAAGGFRLSLGGMVNRNKVSLSADPTEPIELEGTDYDITSLDGEIRFAEFSPYVGIGYGNAVGKDGRVHFSCDFGILYHGAPKVTARAVSTLPGEWQARLDEDLQKEVDDFEDDISGFRYYPLISLGFSVAF
jgi:hypothetical protein